MSVEDHTLTEVTGGPASLAFDDHGRRHSWSFRRYGRGHGRPRVRKLRLLMVLIGFLTLAGASTLFGMLTAIASDLPELNPKVPAASVDSYLYDVNNTPIGVLAPPDESVSDSWGQISQQMVHAIVAVEDKRFWTDPGVDIKGLLRALISDVTGGPKEGASTIPEEFVKNVLLEEGNRTIFEKLREADLAFQLVHSPKWPRWKILTDYLNTIYFGNGATGIESAARVYFGWNHGYDPSNPAGEAKTGCGDPDIEDPDRKECAEVLDPWEAALLAGMVANPTEFDPILHPKAAEARRNLVLMGMYQQHYISRETYEYSIRQSLPKARQIQMPQEPAAAPYFTSWVRPLIINALRQEGVKDPAYEAFYGHLKIHLTIDLNMQEAAQQAVDAEFPRSANGPTASLVAIDNRTGEVRAMVSGDGDYNQSQFNLATLGYRQPGSAFKMFTLAAALSSGKYGPDSIIDSKPLTIRYGPGDSERFVVHNFDNAYAGPITLANATATSDNSVFTQVGENSNVGTTTGLQRIAHYAKAMGIRTSVSQNPAMILGGLSQGVSALDMAHAYETAATGGLKVYNPILGDYHQGAIGISSISGCTPCEQHTIQNTAGRGLTMRRVLSPAVAATIDQLLHGPVDDPYGTGTAAAIPGVDVAGKTGTTSNYVDAWFVGWTPQMTVAVWVGYPDTGKPMLKNFDGGPVEGGTYPAIIWHNFMVRALQIMVDESAAKNHTTATNLGLQSITTAQQQSTSGTQNATATTQTQATNGASAGTAKIPNTNNPKHQAGTQPSVNTGGAPQTIGNTSATPPAGAGTQGAATTPTATTAPSTTTTGTSTSGGASL
jgi:penicillin-binding protein 1A